MDTPFSTLTSIECEIHQGIERRDGTVGVHESRWRVDVATAGIESDPRRVGQRSLSLPHHMCFPATKSPGLGRRLGLSHNLSRAKAVIKLSSLARLGLAYLGLAWLGPRLEAGPEQH